MDKSFTKEDLLYNKIFKSTLIKVLLEQTETFYLHCANHSQLQIGTRGLLEKEKQEGIILVFGPYSFKNLDYDDDGIYCEMNFGKWEKVYIPYECIFRAFDKAGHFLMQFLTMELEPEKEPEKKQNISKNEELKHDNVISIDFNKKKKNKKDSQ